MAKKRGGLLVAGILCMKMGYFYEGGGRLLVAQDSISIESELYKLLNLAKRNCVAYFSQCSAPSFPSHLFKKICLIEFSNRIISASQNLFCSIEIFVNLCNCYISLHD